MTDAHVADVSLTKTELRDRYDRMAAAELDGGGSFEPLNRAKAYFRARKLQAALALGSFPVGGRLLDIGCSVGQFACSLARLGYQVCGMDLSPNSIELAKRRAQRGGLANVSFMVGDAERLSQFPDQAFDGVVSFSTLRYVADIRMALAEIHRVLKPGARAVIDFPNRWCPWFYLKPWLGSERHPHDHWFTSSTVKASLVRAGFCDVQVRHLLFTPTVTPDRLLKVFQGVDWLGERLPLVRRLAAIIIVAASTPRH